MPDWHSSYYQAHVETPPKGKQNLSIIRNFGETTQSVFSNTEVRITLDFPAEL